MKNPTLSRPLVSKFNFSNNLHISLEMSEVMKVENDNHSYASCIAECSVLNTAVKQVGVAVSESRQGQ